MNTLPTYTSPSFAGRNKYIQDAQWVCHTINANLPHFSTTKHIPTYKRLIFEHPNFVRGSRIPESMKEILEFIELLTAQPLKPYQITAKSTKQSSQLLNYAKHLISRLGEFRNKSDYLQGERTIQSSLFMLENFKMGNCYENAKIAELILLLNKIENACIAKLKTPFNQKLNHVVCIFNKDGSQFNGTVNNSTIIIDNWAGKADYAKNMYTYYKNLFKDHFYISKNSPIDFEQIEKLNLSPQEIQELTKKYPDFIFKSTKRKFMSN